MPRKLLTLKPRVGGVTLLRASAVASTERMTGRRLQERNKRLAARNPLCVKCQAEDRISAATEWDHIIPLHLGGADTEENLQGLCHDHHEEKTAHEARERVYGETA